MKRVIVGLKPILDAGHGGMINGIYQTSGKRSPNWESGVLYEGMFNRWFKNRLKERLDRGGIPYYDVSTSDSDTPLKIRVNKANKIYAKDKKVYYYSFHANAGGGTGVEGFTTVGETKADKIFQKFLEDYQDNPFGMRLRSDKSDGDLDKEVNYYVLRSTLMPSMLFEAGFMDHKKDYKLLFTTAYLEQIVSITYERMEKIYKYGISI